MDNGFLAMFAVQVARLLWILDHTIIVDVDLIADHFTMTLWDLWYTVACWGIILKAIELCIQPVGGGADDD